MASAFQTVNYKQHRNESDQGLVWSEHVSRQINGHAWSSVEYEGDPATALAAITMAMQNRGWSVRKTKATRSHGEVHVLRCFKATDVTPKPPRL